MFCNKKNTVEFSKRIHLNAKKFILENLPVFSKKKKILKIHVFFDFIGRDNKIKSCTYKSKILKWLNVDHFAVPKIEILGDRDMYVKTGSTVAIRCVIKQSLEGPFYVFWYHEGDRVLNYQLNKIDIQTKRIDLDTVSSLVIHNAKLGDSGNYTCSPSNLDSASVQLHVLNGKY